MCWRWMRGRDWLGARSCMQFARPGPGPQPASRSAPASPGTASSASSKSGSCCTEREKEGCSRHGWKTGHWAVAGVLVYSRPGSLCPCSYAAPPPHPPPHTTTTTPHTPHPTPLREAPAQLLTSRRCRSSPQTAGQTCRGCGDECSWPRSTPGKRNSGSSSRSTDRSCNSKGQQQEWAPDPAMAVDVLQVGLCRKFCCD